MGLSGIILSLKKKGLVPQVTYSTIPFIQNSLNGKWQRWKTDQWLPGVKDDVGYWTVGIVMKGSIRDAFVRILVTTAVNTHNYSYEKMTKNYVNILY